MLPGKTYKPEDILVIAWRRRWQVIVPFLIVAAGAIRYSQTLPDRYRSETVILIVPQRVPESYVHSTVTSRIEDRLRSINQQIMSRTRLEPIIQTLNLYPGLMKNGLVEDAVARMRLDAEVQVVKGDAFRVSFIANEPRTAMKVTQQLASLFIDENLKDREVLAEDTNQFLDSQLDNAKQRLIEHEKKLEEYRKRYAGQLPTQVQSNLQVIQNAQMQIQSINDSIGRDRDRRLMLERQIADSNAILGRPTPGAPGEEKSATANGDRSNLPGPAAIALEAAVKELRQLETQFKPEHPDVIHQKRIVADLTQKAQVEALALPPSTLPSSPLAPGTRPEVVRAAQTVSQAKVEMDSLDRQLTAKEADLAKLHSIVADYQARVEAVPTRESEMVELTRDYDTLRKATRRCSARRGGQVSANSSAGRSASSSRCSIRRACRNGRSARTVPHRPVRRVARSWPRRRPGRRARVSRHGCSHGRGSRGVAGAAGARADSSHDDDVRPCAGAPQPDSRVQRRAADCGRGGRHALDGSVVGDTCTNAFTGSQSCRSS